MIAHRAVRFVAAYRSVLAASAARDAALKCFVDALAVINAHEAEDRGGGGSASHPALRNLDRAVAQLRGDPDFVAAVREIIPHLSWGGSYQGSGPFAAVAQQMVWGEVVGRNGIVPSDAIKLGCFLLSPGMIYPLHGHEALEVYSVVSGAMTVVHGLDDPVSRLVEAPGWSVTPEGEAHALHVGPEPVLIIYCWIGDIYAPVWWWDRSPDGAWTKSFPDIIRSGADRARQS